MLSHGGASQIQTPRWWYASWELTDWLRTLFNQPIEIHAFAIGLFIGFILAISSLKEHDRTAVVISFAVLLFTFGSLNSDLVCSRSTPACQHVRLKPWYFLAGVLIAQVTSLIANRELSTVQSPATDNEQVTARMLSGSVVVIMLVVAGYSFVSPHPVQPVTGLAVIGGVLGSILGYWIYWRIYRESTNPGLYRDSRKQERRNANRLFILSVGTVVAFAYPRVLWETGLVIGEDGYLFGSILRTGPGLVSVSLYVLALAFATLGLTSLSKFNTPPQASSSRYLMALTAGFATYGLLLYALTGLTGNIWLQLIASM